jgi:hypothetical protein
VHQPDRGRRPFSFIHSLALRGAGISRQLQHIPRCIAKPVLAMLSSWQESINVLKAGKARSDRLRDLGQAARAAGIANQNRPHANESICEAVVRGVAPQFAATPEFFKTARPLVLIVAAARFRSSMSDACPETMTENRSAMNVVYSPLRVCLFHCS